jgi:17beta-estradiol 17-dehydrogenase / very-long-chain 3-oxoacyl-CoA reductase
VTGASDGIGKEFSLQLARAGYNILLVSRTESKLTTLATEITSKYPSTQTKTLAMDFAANKDSDYARLEDIVSGIDIAVLINNVGKSHDVPVPFAQTPEDEMTDIININCLGTLRVTQLVLPGMIQRKKGLILTMGSFGGLLPTPLLATYSGSKAFLQQWSTSLAAEVAPKGITVQLVPAYLITSAMSKVRRPTMMIPNPRGFVSAVLKRIGRSGGAPGIAYTSIPYWSHAIMAWGLITITGLMGKIPLAINKSMHEGIRKRALKKSEREKGKKAA